ncbi:MAG TPA: DUF6325 family protein [Microterricola sp.]
MAQFEFGPVDISVVSFAGDRPDDATIAAIEELIESGEIAVLDLLFVSRAANGDLTVTEFEDVGEEWGFTRIELPASGVIGDNDVDDLASMIEPGRSAAVIAIELLFAKRLTSKLAESGGLVLHSERIPAAVVNAVLSDASDD